MKLCQQLSSFESLGFLVRQIRPRQKLLNQDIEFKVRSAVIDVVDSRRDGIVGEKFENPVFIFDLLAESALLFDVDAEDKFFVIDPDMKVEIVGPRGHPNKFNRIHAINGQNVRRHLLQILVNALP